MTPWPRGTCPGYPTLSVGLVLAYLLSVACSSVAGVGRSRAARHNAHRPLHKFRAPIHSAPPAKNSGYASVVPYSVLRFQ